MNNEIPESHSLAKSLIPKGAIGIYSEGVELSRGPTELKTLNKERAAFLEEYPSERQPNETGVQYTKHCGSYSGLASGPGYWDGRPPYLIKAWATGILEDCEIVLWLKSYRVGFRETDSAELENLNGTPQVIFHENVTAQHRYANQACMSALDVISAIGEGNKPLQWELLYRAMDLVALHHRAMLQPIVSKGVAGEAQRRGLLTVNADRKGKANAKKMILAEVLRKCDGNRGFSRAGAVLDEVNRRLYTAGLDLIKTEAALRMQMTRSRLFMSESSNQ